jgi:hypothetical protein
MGSITPPFLVDPVRLQIIMPESINIEPLHTVIPIPRKLNGFPPVFSQILPHFPIIIIHGKQRILTIPLLSGVRLPVMK